MKSSPCGAKVLDPVLIFCSCDCNQLKSKKVTFADLTSSYKTTFDHTYFIGARIQLVSSNRCTSKFSEILFYFFRKLFSNSLTCFNFEKIALSKINPRNRNNYLLREEVLQCANFRSFELTFISKNWYSKLSGILFMVLISKMEKSPQVLILFELVASKGCFNENSYWKIS